MGSLPDDPLAIPAVLLRDGSNKAEYMYMSNTVEDSENTSRPARKVTKPNGTVATKATAKATGKATAKPAKATAKVAKPTKTAAKAAKGSEKPKVTKAKTEGAKKDQFGLREGSAKSQAAAMYARKTGATLSEVKDAVGSVQLNVLVALEAEGHEVKRVKEEREGQRSVTRYILKMKK